MDATAVTMPAATAQKRYGLYPARIGWTFAHKLGIEMPLETPKYPVTAKQLGATPGARTRARVVEPHFRMGTSPVTGENVAVAALPGATVMLDVQNLIDVEPEVARHVKWACQHPECAGKRWESRDKMRAEHGDEMKLREAAKMDPRGGRAHCYFGVIEIAAKPESKDDKGRVSPAVGATVMIVSDEE
jgi:hypothetical protein